MVEAGAIDVLWLPSDSQHVPGISLFYLYANVLKSKHSISSFIFSFPQQRQNIYQHVFGLQLENYFAFNRLNEIKWLQE